LNLGDLAEILGVLQPNVCAKRFIEHLIGFWLRILCISDGFFDADDLKALRALANAMTAAIHFLPWSKPSHIGQFWFFHADSFPQTGELCQPYGSSTVQPAPLRNSMASLYTQLAI
jgi:hypothetical protein